LNGDDIVVIASLSKGEVVIVRPAVIGGVDARPADAWRKEVNPGMCDATSDELSLLRFSCGVLGIKSGVVEIAASVASGDAERTEVGNEEMGEVLAGAPFLSLDFGRGAEVVGLAFARDVRSFFLSLKGDQ